MKSKNSTEHYVTGSEEGAKQNLGIKTSVHLFEAAIAVVTRQDKPGTVKLMALNALQFHLKRTIRLRNMEEKSYSIYPHAARERTIM